MANLRFVADSLTNDAAMDLGELRAALAESDEGLHRIRAIVERLGTFRAATGPAQPTTDVRRAIDHIVDGLALSPPDRARVVIQAGSPLPAITLDELRLGRVLRAVITNALEAGSATRVRVWAELLDDRLHLIVEDDGLGIAPEVLPRLFEPFVTGTGSGKLGLSLALAREIARVAGGELRAANRAERGARFTVELPLAG